MACRLEPEESISEGHGIRVLYTSVRALWYRRQKGKIKGQNHTRIRRVVGSEASRHKQAAMTKARDMVRMTGVLCDVIWFVHSMAPSAPRLC
jgi:hypothetical protein